MESNKISSPQGPQPAHGARPRSTANTQDAGEAGSGGFLALLAALGSSDAGVGDPLLDTATASDGAPQDGPSDAQDTSFLAAWQGLLPPAANARVDATPQGIQAGALPGGAGAGGLPGVDAIDPGAAAGGAAWGAEAMFGANGGVQGIVAETAMLDASVGSRNGSPLAGGVAHGKAFSRLQSAMAQKADAADTSAGRLQAGTATTQALGGHSGVAGGVLLMNPAERLAGGAAASMPDRAAGGLTQAEAANGLATALTEAAASTALAAGSGGADARGRPGEGRSDGAMGFEAAGGAAPAEAGSVDGATVFADPAQANLEEQVAEQVAYWVNQKTQNAELTLDRDGQPVEVSVTLSGNEAHVAFRSDQSATREMLDKSMAQLSELLRSEGLVLSGMSVGTSSGQREQTGESARQGQRDGGRQARVEAAAPAGTSTLLRTGAPDRAVDVFV